MHCSSECLCGLACATQVELCGRNINVGRPKGYVEPPAGAPTSNLGAAQMFAASITNAATRVLLLTNMLKAHKMWDEAERREVSPCFLLPTPFPLLSSRCTSRRSLAVSAFSCCMLFAMATG